MRLVWTGSGQTVPKTVPRRDIVYLDAVETLPHRLGRNVEETQEEKENGISVPAPG
jgi:hypothetical protein